MHKYILSLGTNLGERLAHLADAVALLGLRGEILAVSSVYETSPVGVSGHGPYLNCALRYSTYQAPAELLAYLHYVEARLGRERTATVDPRPIDIDIIDWTGGEYRGDGLVIPHPHAATRLFVTVPVNEILPGTLPEPADTAGQTVARFCGPEALRARPAG